jgi:hypothetical protein
MNFILSILLVVAMIPLMSVLNRLRGGDKKLGFIELDDVATFAAGLVPCALLFFFSPMFTFELSWKLLLCLIPLGGYIMGESWGWGKWIGGIIGQGKHTEYDKKQGDENGIHWITSQIVDQRDDYLKYCRIALGLRGIWWWLPVILPMFIMGAFGGWFFGAIKLIIATILFGIGFPLSVDVARIAFLKIKDKDELGFTDGVGDGNFVWEWAEWIYGGIHGLLLALLIIL